jgi:hypothetical protein
MIRDGGLTRRHGNLAPGLLQRHDSATYPQVDRRKPCDGRPRGLPGDGQSGNGIAMLILVDIAVRATIRQSDSEANASEAATAWISRGEATGAQRASKPTAVSDNRIMAFILEIGANHPPANNLRYSPGKIEAKSNQRRRNTGGGEHPMFNLLSPGVRPRL